MHDMVALGASRRHDGGVGNGRAVVAADSAGHAGRHGDDRHVGARYCRENDRYEYSERTP